MLKTHFKALKKRKCTRSLEKATRKIRTSSRSRKEVLAKMLRVLTSHQEGK